MLRRGRAPAGGSTVFATPIASERKFAQLREAHREDIIVAISSKLNVEEAGLADLPRHDEWSKTRLKPESVLAVVDMPTVEGMSRKERHDHAP